jgi:pimeloyl-ACP methyl ester carboxylesterase
MSRLGPLLFLVCVGAVAAAGIVFVAYRGELERARHAVRQDSLIAYTAVGPIEYAESGRGPPLLSVHGAGGGYDQGLANAADLVGGSFRVIAPSRFGYLRTPVPRDVSSTAQADAHAALLSELNIAKAIVVGVSAGARSALELAIRHPDRVMALILIVPGTYSPTSPVAVEGSRGSKLVFWLVNHGADLAWWVAEKITPSMLIRFIGVRPELVAASPKNEQERVMRIVRSIQPLSLRFPGINADSTVELHKPPLQKITAPALIVSARDDLFNTLPAAEHAANNISGARLVVYETGGHLLVGRQQEVRDAVRMFLERASLAAQ